MSTAADKNTNYWAEVLTVSNNIVANEWVMDFGCSFYMSPKKIGFKILAKMLLDLFIWEITILTRLRG